MTKPKKKIDSKLEEDKEFCDMVNKLYKYDRAKGLYIDIKPLKQFISQQRTKAYQKGFIDGKLNGFTEGCAECGRRLNKLNK